MNPYHTKMRRSQGESRDFVGFRSQPAGYPAITHEHRGVSAPSFCGADFQPARLSGNANFKVGMSWKKLTQRARRTQRKNWQGTRFSRKKKRHAGLKSGVPRANRGTSWAFEVSPLVTPR